MIVELAVTISDLTDKVFIARKEVEELCFIHEAMNSMVDSIYNRMRGIEVTQLEPAEREEVSE